MVGKLFGKAVARAKQFTEPALIKARASEFVQLLKAEYEAGKNGDPDAQLPTDEADAEQVASALRKIDWAKVRAATSERSADAAATMRKMASQVDWAKVQPVAAKLSSALMAAVASGQLGVGGRLGAPVARAIINDRNMAQRVTNHLVQHEQELPPDFRDVIDVTASEG